MNGTYKDFFKAARDAKKTGPARKKTQKAMPLRKRSQKKFPTFSLVIVMTGLLGAGWGYLYLDEMNDLIGKVQVGWLGEIEAAEKKEEKKSQAKDAKQEKATSLPKSEKGEVSRESTQWSSEELKHFARLSDRKKELDQREVELNELEAELHKQKKEIEDRIKKLEEIRLQIAGVLKEKVEADEGKVQRLVEFYSNMKPQQAAKIMATLNEDLAVEILGKMKKKSAADIMNLLKPEKAQNLTEKFAGYKRR